MVRENGGRQDSDEHTGEQQAELSCAHRVLQGKGLS
jgi:hypothetical protein